MWKCQICETLNEGDRCSVCGYEYTGNVDDQNIKSTIGGVKTEASVHKHLDKRGKAASRRITVTTIILVLLMIVTRWETDYGVTGVHLWHVMFDANYCLVKGDLIFYPFERVWTAITIIMCFVPLIVSVALTKRKDRTMAVILTVFAFVVSASYCIYEISCAVNGGFSSGIFTILAPILMLLMIFFVKAKMKVLKMSEDGMFTLKMYGEDKSLS